MLAAIFPLQFLSFPHKKIGSKKFFNLLYDAIQKPPLVLLPHSPVNKSNQFSPRSITKSNLENNIFYIYKYNGFSWVHAERFEILA